MVISYTRPVVTQDYRDLAERRLPRFLFDYIDGGSNNEETMAANIADFRQYCLKQYVLHDVNNVDTSTTLAGQSAALPVALAPIGMAGMMARRGEVQGARAAMTAGIPFTLSTLGVCPIEEVQAATNSPVWFQLYMLRDREVILSLLERAQAAGCETLVFTVDLAVAGMRHRDTRSGMVGEGMAPALAKGIQIVSRPRWAYEVGLRGGPHVVGNLTDVVPNPTDLNSFKEFIDSQFDASVTWEDIAWLSSVWKGKILIKGILEEENARAAVDVGVDGVIVSNHGGRQLDGVASSISKLPAIVKAVGNSTEVYMDGGVRNGIDVIKAVALGAKGVLMGRPWVWAVAAKGEAGLVDLLDVMQKEVAVAMALMGVNRIDEVTDGLIEKRPS